MSALALESRSDELEAKLREYDRIPYDDLERSNACLKTIVGSCEPSVILRPPFRCALGRNIHLSSEIFVNFDTILCDLRAIEVGPRTKIGPRVRVFSGCAPDSAPAGLEGDVSAGVRIGGDCWFGGDVTVLSGSRIGDRVVIGAGSVVRGDIPSDSIAVGRPARVVRRLSKEEKASE